MSATATLSAPRARAGLLGWLTTTNHKQIGILYMTTTLGFFALAGILSLVIRADLAAPNQQVDAMPSPQPLSALIIPFGQAVVYEAPGPDASPAE